jgi:hypothetical protein
MTFDTRTMSSLKAVHTATGLGEDVMTAEFESIKKPSNEDILCGKNKICIKHPGSKSFRHIIEGYTLKYQQASSRNEKMEVTKEIFDKLQTRRFLKYNEETDMWESLHPLAIRDKIGHALRFSNRKGPSAIRKQVRRSNSDLTSLRQADLASSASLTTSNSLGSMDALKAAMLRNPLRRSTGSFPFPNLKPADLEPNPLRVDSSGFQVTPLGAFSLGGSMHSGFTTSAVVKSSPPLNPGDLSWMLQMPLMEEDDGKVFFVNGQPQHQASV